MLKLWASESILADTHIIGYCPIFFFHVFRHSAFWLRFRLKLTGGGIEIQHKSA
jgi:hypothetical protein